MACAYFVCGMQLVFLTTHLPSYLALCGMDPMLSAQALGTIGTFNIAGSLFFGWAGQRWNKLALLGGLYITRSIVLVVLLRRAADTDGDTGVRRQHGIPLARRRPASPLAPSPKCSACAGRPMIQGIAFVSHQLGSTLGALGGGLLYDALGSYTLAWQIGVSLGLTAGIVQIAFALHRSSRVPLCAFMTTAEVPVPGMRDRILDAADRLFYAHGIQSIGVDAVVLEAGISKRTLYRHFGSRELLIAAYLTRRGARQPERHQAGRRVDEILDVFKRFERWFASDGFRGCPFSNAIAELGGDAGHPALEVARDVKARNTGWFELRLRALGAAHPAGLATRLSILVEGAVALAVQRKADGSAPQVARAAGAAARALLRMPRAFPATSRPTLERLKHPRQLDGVVAAWRAEPAKGIMVALDTIEAWLDLALSPSCDADARRRSFSSHCRAGWARSRRRLAADLAGAAGVQRASAF